MVSKNVEYLREHGPATVEELPNTGVSLQDKQNGVWRVSPSITKNTHTTDRSPKNLWAVYYLKGEHSPREIARKWADANAEKLSGCSHSRITTVTRELPEEMRHHARNFVRNGHEN